MANTPVFTKGGKVVGLLKNGDLYKKARKSVHLFKKVGANGAWGLDYDVLFETLGPRASVYIHETDDDVVYGAKAALWREVGDVMHFNSGGVDHYVQVFLPVEYFTKKKNT